MAGENPQDSPRKPSVFAPVNQDDMIARLDQVSDDDLSSTFFADSMQEVEDAATNVFDIGIRTLTQDDAPATRAGSFGAPGPAAAAPIQPALQSPGTLAHDADRQRAFILGGPAASD
jgi:hypothetical protein